MSLALSLDGHKVPAAPLEKVDVNDGRRGWWDYVPEAAPNQPPRPISEEIGPLERIDTHHSDTPILSSQSSTPTPTRSTLKSRLKTSFGEAKKRLGSRVAVARFHPKPAPYPIPQHPLDAAAPVREKIQRPSITASLMSHGLLRTRQKTPEEEEESKWSKRLPNILRMVIRDEVSKMI